MFVALLFQFGRRLREIVSLLLEFSRRLLDPTLLRDSHVLDGAVQLVDFVLLRISLGFQFLGDASALVLGLLAANFQLLGLAGESLLKLLATTAAAGDLLDFVLCLGHSSLVRLPVFGEFVPCSLEFSALPR